MNGQRMYNAAAAADNDDVTQQRRSNHTDNQRLPVMESEGSDRKLVTNEEIFMFSKTIFNEEIKVKEKIDSMDDLDDLTQSSETVSEHCELPHSNYKNFMLLTEQLCMDCKDSVNLLKICNAFFSNERLIELKECHCELLTEKIKRMENRVTGLHRELSASREMTSQLEHQKVELEQELRNMRSTLKEGKEKRRNADLLHEKTREQLRKKEEQCIKETETNRELESNLRALEMELKIVRKNFSQNDDLAAKLETAFLKCLRLDVKNKCLQQELLSMKAIQKKCEQLDNENEKLKQDVVNLERKLKMNMIEYREVIQYKQKIKEKARQDLEEEMKQVSPVLQLQKACQENSEQLKENHNASIISQLQVRNKDLEYDVSTMKTRIDNLKSKVSKMKARNKDLKYVYLEIKTSQCFNKIELEKYKHLYLEELEGRKSLTKELNKTQEKLAEVNTELLLQKERNSSLQRNLNRRSDPETPAVGNLTNSFLPSSISTPREKVIPTLDEMQQEFQKMLSKELEQEVAEFEYECSIAYHAKQSYKSDSNEDRLLKAKQEYAEILKKNYML